MLTHLRQAERDPNPDDSSPTSTRTVQVSSTDSQFFEHSFWEGIAEEDTAIGLKRLAMLAKDECKKDDSKTAEQYYSERLSKIIKEGEIKYDCSGLHQ